MQDLAAIFFVASVNGTTTMRLAVRTLDYCATNIDVKEDELVEEVKVKVAEALLVESEDMLVVAKGKELVDGHNIQDYGLKEGDKIFMVRCRVPNMRVYVHHDARIIAVAEAHVEDTVTAVKKKIAGILGQKPSEFGLRVHGSEMRPGRQMCDYQRTQSMDIAAHYEPAAPEEEISSSASRPGQT